MDKKYQVFISSTYKDLIEQRNQVVESVLRLGHLPVGMEIFNAASQTPWDVIKSHINNSDYYVVILAHRYGSVAPDGIGFTEKEYDYAVARGIPCLGFVLRDGVSWSPELVEQKPALKKKLAEFKKKIMHSHISYWETTADLANQVLLALVDETRNRPGVGWVRADAITASPQVGEELARLSRENSELKSALASRADVVDEVVEAEQILRSHNLSVKSTLPDGKHNFLVIFEWIAEKMLSPIGPRMLTINSQDEMSALGYNDQHTIDREIITPLVETLTILGIADTTSGPNGARYYELTSKGKKLLARLKYSSGDSLTEEKN